jgi:hypothetical protein
MKGLRPGALLSVAESGTVENLHGIDTNLAVSIGEVGPVAHQPPCRRELPPFVHRRSSVAGCKLNQLLPPLRGRGRAGLVVSPSRAGKKLEAD